MIPAIVVLSLLLIFFAFILIRAAMFRPEEKKSFEISEVSVDTERAVRHLSEMIKCKTISDRNKENELPEEFEKFKKILPEMFPTVFSRCKYIEIGDRGILFKWEGKKHGAPTVLMAHYDVVSVVEELWEKPAFDGIVEDGYLWGRGTLDTKGTLNGILEAAETLISEGFVPENDIYFAFGGDEEINGHGSPDIVNYFKEEGITPALVVDEGGAVVENIFPGVKRPSALIGINEKGMLNLEYSVKGVGGHSSSPAPHTPVGKLSAACVKVENHPFKFRITYPAKKMFDTLGRHSTFLYRIIFANLWLFSPILNMITKKSGGELNAIVRTTVAFTQMEGSKGMNVIPPQAKMVSNLRLLPGDTMNSALEYIKKTVNDDSVEIKIINGMNPSRISVTECEAFERLSLAVNETWQRAIVSPYPMVACSDARHWGEISDKVYRFSAMELSTNERGLIHGNNERVSVETVGKTVEFFIRLISKC